MAGLKKFILYGVQTMFDRQHSIMELCTDFFTYAARKHVELSRSTEVNLT